MRPGRRVRGFSMVEVLSAIFILSIGLIMVLSIFPVGAKWTQDAVEDSVEQIIAQDALAVIKAHYGPGGNLHGWLSPQNMLYSPAMLPAQKTANPAFIVQGIPDLPAIPLNERSYEYGSAHPFPAENPAKCTYFWTALCRLDTRYGDSKGRVLLSPSYTFNIYIIVYHAQEAGRTYPIPHSNVNGQPIEITNDRGPGDLIIPSLYWEDWAGESGENGPIPAGGYCGIGMLSGTVFRQVISAGGNLKPNTALASARSGWFPSGPGDVFEPVIAPFRANKNFFPCPNISYIYQTTLSY